MVELGGKFPVFESRL